MPNGKPNRPIRPRGGGPKGRRRVVIEGGTGRPGAGQRHRPGDRALERGPKAPRDVVPPTGPVTVESGVTLRDFSILQGGWFGILATGVDNLTIDNLIIDTNRDGMDIDCCKNVRVSNCTVNSP